MNESYVSTTAETAEPVSRLDVGARATFITRTYTHLFGAIAAFTLIEFALFQSGLAERIATAMMGTSWLLVLGGFILVSWVATVPIAAALSIFFFYFFKGLLGS